LLFAKLGSLTLEQFLLPPLFFKPRSSFLGDIS
jgi:hypothetical protein